jgi:geranylgeranylglycerol-phosphate geranylgeranyltransferase
LTLERGGKPVGILARASGVVELLRPHNLLVAFFTTFIGYAAVVRDAGLSIRGLFSDFVIAAMVVVLIAAGGYVINDYYDVETDAVAKPWRPIVSGRVSRRAARVIAYTLFAAGIMLALVRYYCALPLVAFVLLNALLVHEYSRWIKRRGFMGNLVIAFNSASTILFGYLAACYDVKGHLYLQVYALIPSLYAFLLVLGREVVKGLEDIKGDSVAGIRTLAVVLGLRKASISATLILLLVVLLSPLPYISGLFNIYYLILASIVDALILLSIKLILAWKEEDEAIKAAAKARSLLKWSFLLGALAFIIGLY